MHLEMPGSCDQNVSLLRAKQAKQNHVIWGTAVSSAEFFPVGNETELQKDLISSVIGLGKTGSPQ